MLKRLPAILYLAGYLAVIGGLVYALMYETPGRPTTAQLHPPAALDCTMAIVDDGRTVAQAVPITKWELLIPDHAVGKTPLAYHGKGVYGVARVIARNSERDLAVLSSDTPLPCTVPFAATVPAPAERLWWLIRIPGGQLVPVHGFFLGINGANGDFLIDGVLYPGTSGSMLVNESGQMVGMQHASGKLQFGPFRDLGFATPLIAGRGALLGMAP